MTRQFPLSLLALFLAVLPASAFAQTAGGSCSPNGATAPAAPAASGQNLLCSSGTWGIVSASSPWTLSGSTVYYNGGNIGIGTTSPSVKLTLLGADSSINGPHVEAFEAADTTYPIFQQLNWTHNNISLNFDGYYNGGSWVSSSNTGSFQIYKQNNVLNFNYGVANAGSGVSLTSGMTLTTTGSVGIGTTNPGYSLDVQSAASAAVNIQTTNTGTSATAAAVFKSSSRNWAIGTWNSQNGGDYPGMFGIQDITGNNMKAIFDASGNIYFGTMGNAGSVAAAALAITSTSSVGIGTTSPGYTLTVNGTAWVTSGSWSGSDRRWKKDIVPLTDALDKVSRLQGVYFNWRRDEFPEMRFVEGLQIGLIAQDTEKVLPEVVTTDKAGYKGISYEKLTPVLVEAVKELKAANDNEAAEIAALRREIDGLKQQLGATR